MERVAGSREPAEAEPFAVAYARRWQELRGLEWAAWTTGMPLDRSCVDREIHRAACGPTGVPVGHPDGPLVDRVRRRALVDHHPEVARLRDRLEDVSSGGPHAASSPTLRQELAAAMEPDLVTLVGLRHRLAVGLGADSYVQLAMEAEGLDFAAVSGVLTETRRVGLVPAADLATGEGLTIESWSEGLDRMAGPSRLDALAAARDLASRLACEDLFERVQVRVQDGPLAGWAAALSIPDDIRLLVRPARSLRDVATVFHEVGHALAYAGTRVGGFRAIPSDTQDETMGSVLELVGSRLLLSAEERLRLDRIAVAETTRLATSALFEIAIQDDPAHARERFVEWYAPLVPVPDPAAWALDSFRSADPFRVHAYVLGQAFAGAVADGLQARFADDAAAWGSWLREVLWAPGRRDTYAELVAP